MEKVKHEHVIGDVTVTVELPAGMPEPRSVSLRWKAQDADDFERLAGMAGGLDSLYMPTTRQNYEQSATTRTDGALTISIEEPTREDEPRDPRHPFFAPFAERAAAEEVEANG